MRKRTVLLLLCGLLCLGGTACKSKKTQAELTAEKVKQFRVRQKQMAAKAYKDLAEKYPDSEFAAEARQRLEALGPIAATPAPKKK